MNLTNVVQTALDRGAVSYSLSTGEYIVNEYAVSKATKKVFHLTDAILRQYVTDNSEMLATDDNFLHIEQSGAKWMMSVKDTSVTIKIVRDKHGDLRINCSRDGVNLLDILDAMALYKDREKLMAYIYDNCHVNVWAKIRTKYHPLGIIKHETFLNFIKTKS